MQLTVRLNCPISVGFIKQFYQLDKEAGQKVSPLTIALEKKRLTGWRIFTVFMFQINVKINLLSKIVLWVLETVAPPIWMVWGARPRLSHYLEMTVNWGEVTMALSLVFQDVQGLIHYSPGSS